VRDVYAQEHWEKVAEVYAREGTVAKTQDHFPWASYSSVARWVVKCRALGLLPPR
jgi:cobalamin biosynthesis Mg chelatase CobN